MSAADVSAIVDLVSAPESTSPAPTPAPEPEISAPDTTLPETPEVDAAPAPDTTESVSEPAPDPAVDARTNPAQVRSALKTLRDSDPKNAPIARELNDAYGRYNAYKESFPTVADARNAKAFLEANGGIEGLTSLHETVKSVNDTDALLYSGDPRLFDSIIEDLRAENKLDAFTKLGPSFLDNLRKVDEKGYFNVLKPHFYQGLVDTGVPNVVQQLSKFLSGDKPDLEGAKGLLAEMSNWLNGLRDTVERTDKSKLDPERQAFEKERSDYQTNQRKEFSTGVANTNESYNNTALGEALKPYFKLPYFKNLTSNRASLISLAKEVKSTLFEELTADKNYRGQMDAFFAGKTPDKARISQFHNSKVDTMAKRIVKQVIENRYPDYARRVAPVAKPAATAPTTTPVGQPEYVKAKPEWESIDWDKDPSKMLFVTGKAYLKGSNKFVYWGKPKK